MSWFSGGDQLTTMLFTSGRTCKEPGTSGTRVSKYHTWSALRNETLEFLVARAWQQCSYSFYRPNRSRRSQRWSSLSRGLSRSQLWLTRAQSTLCHAATLKSTGKIITYTVACLSWSYGCKSSQETKAQIAFWGFIKREGKTLQACCLRAKMNEPRLLFLK